MPDSRRELVGAEGDEQHDADDEGETSCNDQKGCELVKVLVAIARSILEVNVSRTSNYLAQRVPEKCSPTRRIVRTRQTAKPVRCAEERAIFILILY